LLSCSWLKGRSRKEYCVLVIYSFILLSDIPCCGYTTLSLAIHLYVDI
jgi:hypothetical protein